jgi:uncharacterized membrane protein
MVRHNGNAAVETTAVREEWVQWPVFWTAIWVGTLTALATALVIGLAGIALGAHMVGPENRLEDLRKVSLAALAFSVLGAFFAFVAGGWVAGKIAGILRSETGMLHGAIVWLLAVPFLVTMAALGAGSFFGSWYGGLGGTPSWAVREAAQEIAAPTPLGDNATPEQRAQFEQANRAYEQSRVEKDKAARAARNTALTALTALLLGLIGSVLGGWLASGEPMSLTYYRTRAAMTGNTATTRAPEPVAAEPYVRR